MVAICLVAALQTSSFQITRTFNLTPPEIAKVLRGPDEVEGSAAWYKLNDSACVWVEFEGDGKKATGFAVEYMEPSTTWQQALKAVGLASAGVKTTAAGANTISLTGVKDLPAGLTVLYKKAHQGGNWDNSTQLSIFRKGREDMLRIEAERLVWTTEGGEMVPCDQFLSGSTVVLWEHAGDGDITRTKIPITTPGDYEVFLHCGFDASMGGVMADLNGKSKSLDFRYSATAWRDVSLGIQRLDKPGNLNITLMALGDRGRGNFAYHLALDWVRVERRRAL